MFPKLLILSVSLAAAGLAQNASGVCGAAAISAQPLTMVLTFTAGQQTASGTTMVAVTPVLQSKPAVTTATPAAAALSPSAISSSTAPVAVSSNSTVNQVSPSNSLATVSSNSTTNGASPSALNGTPQPSIKGIKFLGGSGNCYTYEISGQGFGSSMPAAAANGQPALLIAAVASQCGAFDGEGNCSNFIMVPVGEPFELVNWSDTLIIVDLAQDFTKVAPTSPALWIGVTVPGAPDTASMCWAEHGGSCQLGLVSGK